MNRMSEIIELLISLKANHKKRQVDDKYPTYSLRKLSTGTFELFVAIYLPIATAISGFIFLVIKKLQQAKERELSIKLKEKELAQNEMKINSQFINDAAIILSINPKDETSKRIITEAAMRTLEYIKHNPSGVINDMNYSIPETSTLEIEEITLEIEKSTNNGEV